MSAKPPYEVSVHVKGERVFWASGLNTAREAHELIAEFFGRRHYTNTHHQATVRAQFPDPSAGFEASGVAA